MDPFTCANWKPDDTAPACSKQGMKPCDKCNLVMYCSDKCLEEHRKTHKVDCEYPLNDKNWRPDWDTEGRQPKFFDPESTADARGPKYLWGNMPAFDLLHLKGNEGVDTNRDLSIFMAASGDLRNFFKTIASLPDTYTGKLTVDINDKDEAVVARNLLLLLIAIFFAPEEASVMMLHLWYSAFLPENMMRAIREKILPALASRAVNRPTGLSGREWARDNFTLRARLDDEEWERVKKYCLGKSAATSFNDAKVLRERGVFPPSEKDDLHRKLFRLRPSYRVAKMKFWKCGILLPFGAPCDEFEVPNLAFFENDSWWPMTPTADPLAGWAFSDVLKETHPASDDLYGLLYLHVSRMLREFCKKLNTVKLDVFLYQQEAVSLAREISGKNRLYDRIEISNICDTPYLGYATSIEKFGPLLCQKKDNPKATLVMLFLNAITEIIRENYDKIELPTRSLIEEVRKHLKIDDKVLKRGSNENAEYVRFSDASWMFLDNEHLFALYTSGTIMSGTREDLHLSEKSENTIIAKWPMRVNQKNCSHEEFNVTLWSSHIGVETYVEWCRT